MVTRWNIRTTGFFAVRVAVSYFSRNHQVVRLVDIPFWECLRAHASVRIAQSCILSLSRKNSLSSKRPRPFNYPLIKIPI